MSRTVTAFFDTREEAQAAQARLQSSSIDADRIRIIDKSSSASTSAGTATSSDGENRGFFSSLTNMFLPDEDAYSYSEGINRGGYLLCATVDDHEADEATRILEESNSVDFESREQEWRSSGWSGYDRNTHGSQYGLSGHAYSASGAPTTANSAAGTTTAGMGQQSQSFGTSETMGDRTVAEEHIPLVEEELRVGKREVNRGGARVRSYVREIPVHEAIRLRDEHVSVERRPVDQRLGAGELTGDLLREREIEMTETHEEAVVGKEARVREELVVRKTAEEHEEQIDDTVRRTEVEVDEGLTGRTGMGSTGPTGTGTGSAFGFQDRDHDGTPDAVDTDLDRTNDPAYRR
jgi:uncharacterized protein (TIGR02271 family)